MRPEPVPYVGRFAPSPTGPLHFGSLVAAVASYLQARQAGGRWLLRIEDIDPPREQPGAAEAILKALVAYGFEWDGDVIYQSAARKSHEAIVATLLSRGLAYPCGCSRSDLAELPGGPLGSIYPGTCRSGCDAEQTAIRIRTTDERLSFVDSLQGEFSQRLEIESGDFVIRRKDNLIAYQLAVVADDEHEGITEVVRGLDLLDSTPRQIWLQKLLGFRTPAYAHIPVITDPSGAKLSKNTGASGIPVEDPGPTLLAALEALRQEPPQALERAPVGNIWQWAMSHWEIGRLRGVRGICSSTLRHMP